MNNYLLDIGTAFICALLISFLSPENGLFSISVKALLIQ